MKDLMKQYAAKKQEREEGIYSLEEDWHVYGANCPTHPGVRKYLVGEKEKKELGYAKSALVWKCPVDGEIFAATGTVAEQTDGFAAHNNLHKNREAIIDEGFEAAKKLSKAMGYETSGPEGN